ncbi:MAG: nicotinate (nicotinamide) nucleotide adenylyltransferase [Chloroflexi bacterium]|nr:nicotinate (nicotinamide) nucleotide adenylyltransferase [Chloroflexota bacterium]
MSAKKCIGIFGGTFDPPHLGHLILASEAVYQLNLDRLLFILTADPPHKTQRRITTLEERLVMVQAVVDHDPIFELSRIEIDRPGPHYSVDTVRLLQGQHPEDEIIYLMGGDSLRTLPTWSRGQEFVEVCNEIGVMRRPGELFDLVELEKELPGLANKLQFIDAPLLEIASREIRARIADGGAYRYYLYPSVYEVIKEKGLYKEISE